MYGVRGVSVSKGKYVAGIGFKYKSIELGTFDRLEAAAAVRACSKSPQ